MLLWVHKPALQLYQGCKAMHFRHCLCLLFCCTTHLDQQNTPWTLQLLASNMFCPSALSPHQWEWDTDILAAITHGGNRPERSTDIRITVASEKRNWLYSVNQRQCDIQRKEWVSYIGGNNNCCLYNILQLNASKHISKCISISIKHILLAYHSLYYLSGQRVGEEDIKRIQS